MSVSYNQLALYLTPDEVRDRYSVRSGEFDDYEMDESELYDRKREEAKDRGLYHNIQTYGVQKPIKIDSDYDEILDGHHRIASAREDDLIPITYHSRPGRMLRSNEF